MKDYYDIAKQFADKEGLDVVQYCTERNGYHYFYLNYTVRPRYMGHPHIIKISPIGKIQWVRDFHERYWAYNLRVKEPGQ